MNKNTLYDLDAVCMQHADENLDRLPSSSWANIYDSHHAHQMDALVKALDGAGDDPAAIAGAWKGWRDAIRDEAREIDRQEVAA